MLSNSFILLLLGTEKQVYFYAAKYFPLYNILLFERPLFSLLLYLLHLGIFVHEFRKFFPQLIILNSGNSWILVCIRRSDHWLA
jgi:hypothetical protein